MTGPPDPKPTTGWRATVRRILTPPLVVLAAFYLFLEEYLWVHLAALIARLSKLKAVARLEARVAALPPYPAMALFAIPTALIFPLKLLALYLIAAGHAVTGLVVIVLAKIVGTAIVARLFTLCRPQLMTVQWFARLYTWIVRVRDDLYARVRRMPAWQRAHAIVQATRDFFKRLVRA
jgi:hypothetical protein